MARGRGAFVPGWCGLLTCILTCISAARPAPPAAPAAGANAGTDPVKEQLARAVAIRADMRAKWKAWMIKVLDDKIKATAEAGDLEALKALTTQKDAFVTAEVRPTLPDLKEAVAQYDLGVRKVDAQLVTAFEAAIQEYTAQSKFTEAMALRQQRRALLEGGEVGAPGGVQTPEGIAAALQRAKAAHQQIVLDAKAALLAAIDARLTTVTNAGDLQAVTALRAVRATAEGDGSIPDDVRDPVILAAKTRYNTAVQAANARAAQAYQDAIRDYTRAQRITEAQAVQAEFDASGLGRAGAAGDGGAVASGPAAAPTRLGRILPPLLLATDPFTATKEGITLKRGTVIKTKPADFLSRTRDWVFDVWVQVPQDGEWAAIGIGDGTVERSLTVSIRPPGDKHRGVALTKGDIWGDGIGDMKEPGLYVARIEKHGDGMTFSLGTEQDGKFEAEMSRTVDDVKAFMPNLSERSAHLFFGGGVTFQQYRLSTRPAAANPAGAAGSP